MDCCLVETGSIELDSQASVNIDCFINEFQSYPKSYPIKNDMTQACADNRTPLQCWYRNLALPLASHTTDNLMMPLSRHRGDEAQRGRELALDSFLGERLLHRREVD